MPLKLNIRVEILDDHIIEPLFIDGNNIWISMRINYTYTVDKSLGKRMGFSDISRVDSVRRRLPFIWPRSVPPLQERRQCFRYGFLRLEDLT